MTRTLPLAVSILAAAAFATTDAVAQSPADLLEVPDGPRNRVSLLGPSARDLDSNYVARPATFAERLGFAAITTAVGAGLGYSWWHSCNDPESDAIWSCIVAPRRLGTSVRFGAYSGLAVGLAGILGDLEVTGRRKQLHEGRPRLHLDHRPRSGFRLGINFRF